MNKQTNIAYLYLCHNNYNLLKRVSNALLYGKDKIFVHVDKKVDIEPFINATKDCKNIYFIKNRINNYWGGFNSITATMELIRTALKYGNFSRFVLLQGQDYPLVSASEMHFYFDKNKDVEFCKAKDITVSKNKGDYMKWAGFWYMDSNKNNIFIKFIRFLLGRINALGVKYRSGIFSNNNDKWHIYKGWAQFSLTRDCVEHILYVYDNNERFNRYMKHRFPPDEIYIHTIVYNSKFKNNISKNDIIRRDGSKTLLNLTYFEYPKTVTIFTKVEDYQWLKNTGCLFVRKVNENSKDLLDEIDKNILLLK